jgi:molybdopterin synthase sulfur carrier subunit
VKILFYGRLAEAIGPELQMDVPTGSSVAELRGRLASEHPQMAEVFRSNRARTCVGDSLVHDDYHVAAGDTLEFLPPVSGG